MSPKKQKPVVYVIAGPNGAGKTTFAMDYLLNEVHCEEFVNADMIARGLSPFNEESVATPAGRLFLERIHLLAEQKKDFAFETTLSGKGHVKFLRDLQKAGYETQLYFFWIPTAAFAQKRVISRVRKGGHNIPADVIKRRFKKGVANLFSIYRPLCTRIFIFDNSSTTPELVAVLYGNEIEILAPAIWEKIRGMTQ
ncbi:MAG: zeta toxin family protein [Kiritimatiellales bacterium]|nr:zeta toxin family protein [Kiritimatiellales bacterium]